ncbi:hypothetical protein D9M71_427100 [compost metagenome]
MLGESAVEAVALPLPTACSRRWAKLPSLPVAGLELLRCALPALLAAAERMLISMGLLTDCCRKKR